MTVAICVPVSMEYVPMAFAASLAALTASTQEPIVLSTSTASMGAAHTRNLIMNGIAQLENQGIGIDWLFWLDSDMVIPPDTVNRLIAHGKDIVGASYVRRAPPYELLGKSLSGKPESVKGLVEVKALPTGCLLIRRSVFHKIAQPYFKLGINANQIIGEDLLFCAEARDAGFQIWMDTDLTKEVGHIGSQTFYPPVDDPNEASVQAGRGLIVPPPPPSLLVPSHLNGRG